MTPLRYLTFGTGTPDPRALPSRAPICLYGGMLRRACALALLLAACGGDTNTSDSASSGAGTGGSSGGAPTTDNPGTTTAGPGTTAELPTTDPGTTAATATTGDASTGEPAIDYTQPGPHPVGNARFVVPNGDRDLLVELWYPADATAADAAAAGHPIADFVPAGPDRDAFDGLLAALSPAGKIGTRLQTRSALDAKPAAGGPWPTLAFSHCFNCVRFSTFSVAERLASHGFLVAAPDHTGGTLFDDLKGEGAPIGEDFLKVRTSDISTVLDAVLDPNSTLVPAPLRGLADPAHVGVYGHSYGAATSGRVAQDDPRVRAALPIAAPVENPLFPGTHVADIHVPMLVILAEEDNSIGKLGNNLIELNFANQNPPARLVPVTDAGHWGFTDICGLTMGFSAGCGEGLRQSVPGEPFTYLDIEIGRGIASAYTLAFFDLYLRDNQDAAAYVDAADPPAFVAVETRL